MVSEKEKWKANHYALRIRHYAFAIAHSAKNLLPPTFSLLPQNDGGVEIHRTRAWVLARFWR